MTIYHPLIIKRYRMLLGLVVLLLGFVAIPVNMAEARPTVYCLFSWDDNPDPKFNVERWETSVEKKVRTKEYDRLIAMGEVSARVAADRGARCQLNHPENTRIDIKVTKADHKLDEGGRIPHCADLNATVECRGNSDFIAHVHREPIEQAGDAADGEIRTGAGKCLDVHAPCQQDNGCKVQVWDCNGAQQQTWVASGVEIRSGAGKCLDVHSPCRNENGCKVQVWDCNGSLQQTWNVSGNEIRSGTGKCLDVHAPCQEDNGCKVQVWDCNGSRQQTWTLR